MVAAEDDRTVCRIPVLDSNGSGTENSPIGAGNSVYVASTYGYPYPAAPDGAGPAQPADAPFGGGLTRVDIDPGGSGCAIRWNAGIRSAAVPKLSVADGMLYTVERAGILDPARTASWIATTSWPWTRRRAGVAGRLRLGTGFVFDTLQMAGNATAGGVWWQGTVTGVVRIAPR
ncbi:hypothetical protein [Streptomyces sp. S186]|uniref:hypothetical protein n=1 Tax=Streptomyces sp. S186 TaxID=3434395 RepID=UPI003F66DE39